MRARRTAEALAETRRARRPLARLDEPPRGIAEAYAAQAALFHLLEGERAAPAGWKVGATAVGMQRYLGIDGPAFGRIARRDMHADGARFARNGLLGPGIECEIAVRLGADAPAGDLDRAAAAAVAAEVMPAIEIVENRYADFAALGLPVLVADNFFHRACVLGRPAPDWRSLDLAAAAGETRIDGNLRGTGRGADVMGHPFEVVAWLANALRGQGLGLRAGDIVLTGSMAPVIWLDETARHAAVSIEGIGNVGAEFA